MNKIILALLLFTGIVNGQTIEQRLQRIEDSLHIQWTVTNDTLQLPV